LIDYRQKSPETIASGLVWNEADHREPEATATGPSGDSTVRNPLLAAGFFAPWCPSWDVGKNSSSWIRIHYLPYHPVYSETLVFQGPESTG